MRRKSVAGGAAADYGVKTEYGHFSKDGREYIVTRPDTPRPWFNFLFNDVYHALVSQTAGGFSYYKDPKYNRILRYDHLHPDRPGRYFFIKDHTADALWSATWQPFRKPLAAWECRHGIGYTKISAEEQDVSTEITYFVPLEAPVEIALVKVKNDSKQTKNLSIYPFVEFVSGDVTLELVYRNILSLYNRSEFDAKQNAIVAYKLPYTHRPVESYSFFASSLKADAFETHKEAFFGRYGSVESPAALSQEKLGSQIVCGEDMVGVFQHNLTLYPGEEKQFVVVLGFAGARKEIAPLIEKFATVAKAEQALQAVHAYWQARLSSIVVETPDPNFNVMMNIWGRYQLFAITHWRGTSQYHGGEGGLGYRDTAQDIEGLLSLDMDIAMEKLNKILFYQYNSGHAVSGFSDIEGPWENTGDGVVTGKADVAVWLPYTLVSYIKETGDVAFLKKEIAFHDGGKATVYEHVLRAIRYLYSKRGDHGLPLIFKADWNDAYDSVGIKAKGESVWLGMALCRACRQVASLARFIKDDIVAREMEEKYTEIRKIINDVAWDGQWYLAAFNDDGLHIGSAKNDEGNVPLNSQTWALLGEVVTDDRKASILDKIDNYLATEYGPALFLPSYTKWNPGIGRVTAFAPGTKENAAVFSHACAFKVVADCFIGRGSRAYETFAQVMPMNPAKAEHPDRYKAEPYVFSEYVIGPGHPQLFGEGTFTWNTGTVPWMFLAATEWILGARREFEGLLIDPCLPKQWNQASIRRPFRGAVYNITIENPDGVEKGVRSVTVDGKLLEGQLIPPHSDGKEHTVQVVMGKA